MSRRTNIELLRILSIYMIIVFHCVYKSGFAFSPYFSINKFFVKIFWMYGEVGVNLFILITGYFMIKGIFKPQRLISLAAEVLFYHQATFLIAYKLGIYPSFGGKQILLSFFPITTNYYWFITAYVITYLLSPYLNMFACLIKKEDYKKILILVLILFSVIPTIFGLFYNSTETMLYYNRLIWFLVMYLIGAYIRLYGLWIIREQRYACGLSVGAFLLLVISILLIQKYDTFFARIGTSEIAYLWPPNSVPILILSIGIFGIFLRWKIERIGIINKIASTTLGIYMLHDGVLSDWLWRSVFRCADYQDSSTLIFRILISGGVILCTGVVIDLLRQMIGRWLSHNFLSRYLTSFLCKNKTIN